jgi:hypothetical protein
VRAHTVPNHTPSSVGELMAGQWWRSVSVGQFGSGGVVRTNMREEQLKLIKHNHLISITTRSPERPF